MQNTRVELIIVQEYELNGYFTAAIIHFAAVLIFCHFYLEADNHKCGSKYKWAICICGGDLS